MGVGGRHGAAGQVDGGEGGTVQRLEGPADRFAPVVGSHQARQVGALGPGQAQGDGQAHVGWGGLGDGGAVGELHHGVDDGLGVDDDVDPLGCHVEQEVGLDELEPLVDEGRGVDGHHRPHVPGGVLESGGGTDPGELGAAAPAEGAAGGGQDQPPHLAASAEDGTGQSFLVAAAGQGLGDGGVLGVHGDDLARSGQRLADQGAPDDEGLLVGQGQAGATGQGGQRGQQSHRAGDAVDDRVAGPELGGLDRRGGGVGAGENGGDRVGAAGLGGCGSQGLAQALGEILSPAGDGHDGNLPGDGLAGQELQARSAGGQGDHSRGVLPQAGEDLEGLGADRPGGSQEDQSLWVVGGRWCVAGHGVAGFLRTGSTSVTHSTDRRTSTTRAR